LPSDSGNMAPVFAEDSETYVEIEIADRRRAPSRRARNRQSA
jgi:hypothetical protein